MRLALIRRRGSSTGGAELYVQRLLTALCDAGHACTLFAEEWPGVPSGVTFAPVPVRPGGRSDVLGRFAESVRSVLDPSRFDCVFSLERTLDQDVYRAGDGVHQVWLEQRRRHAPWWRRPFIGRGRFHRGMCRLEQRTFDPRNSRRIIVNSGMVREEILRCFGYPEERIHLVRNGVDVARFRSGDREAGRRRWGVRPEEPLLLFVGSGWERKGLPQLLRALGHPALVQRGVRLLVLGRGRLSRVPSNVILGGTLPDLETAYAAADVLAFLPIYEPSANVVPEALAAGLPVITSAWNGAAEWIRPGVDGEIVADPDDPDAVVAALVPWIDRAPARITYGAPAELGLERNVAETVAVLELAARERKR